MESKPVKVQAEVMWAFLDQPNQLSGRYQVDLCKLSEEAKKALEAIGIEVRTKESSPEKGYFVTAKSLNFPIIPLDKDGNKITAKVGNGSKCIALVNPYTYAAGRGYKAGIGAGIKKLVITDLVVYEGASVEDTADDIL